MTVDLRALAARVETAPYPRRLGVCVEAVGADGARVRVPYVDRNSNPGRALHGGVAASTIDVAATLAACAGVDDGLETAVVDCTVSYLAAAIGEDIVADARVLRRGKELAFVEVDVRNDAGKGIAKGLVTHRAAPPASADRRRPATAEPVALPDEDVPEPARLLLGVPFIASLGLTIRHMHDGTAIVEMASAPDLRDADDAFHDGAIAALLDTTGAMASWSVTGLDFRYKASTVGLHLSHHVRGTGEAAVAHGRVRWRTDELFHVAVEVSGAQSHRVLAAGTVTYRIVVP